MRVNKFLQQKIKELTVKFQEIKCSYSFDTSSDTHYIEILPVAEFNNSSDLQCAQADIYDSFDEKYPNESLVFISSDSLTKISNPLFVSVGSKYGQMAARILWFTELRHNANDFAGSGLVAVVSAGSNNYALAA